MTRGVHDPDDPSRPVRRPMRTEYELAVAKDLSRSVHGVCWDKARALPMLPLFFVAIDGKAGMHSAVRALRQRERMAA